MPITKGDHIVIKRAGDLLEPDDPEYEELEVIDYPVDHPMRGEGRTLLLIVKRVS